MGALITLHTQELVPPQATSYLDLLSRSLRAARLNSGYPDRRRLQASLGALDHSLGAGIYEQIYVDSRVGLPNMATLTRVLTDQEVASESLARMGPRPQLVARAREADAVAHLVDKHDYYQELVGLALAPVDDQRVLLRRHDPRAGEAAFRVELTKLDGSGLYLHLSIELTQVASTWRRRVIDLEQDGETAAMSQAFRSAIYKSAHLDAETIFVRLHAIEGVRVERVQRGIIGPALFFLPEPGGGIPAFTAEASAGPLAEGWTRWLLEAPDTPDDAPEWLLNVATDCAAIDIHEERSNDPLVTLLSERLTTSEQLRYQKIRAQYPFRVFKDRKFVATRGLKPLALKLQERANTRNIVYDLR